MHPTEMQKPSPRRSRFWRVCAIIVGLGALVLAVVVFNFLTLNREATALREELFTALDLRAKPQVQISAGPVLLTLARAVTGCIDEVPPEARRALQALRSASVGVYSHAVRHRDSARLFAAADRAMNRRDWNRVVGVNAEGSTVLVYMPERSSVFGTDKVCVAVCSADRLVVVAATVERDALVELVREQPEFRRFKI